MGSDIGSLSLARRSVLRFIQESKVVKSMMRDLVAKNPLVDVKRYEWEHP